MRNFIFEDCFCDINDKKIKIGNKLFSHEIDDVESVDYSINDCDGLSEKYFDITIKKSNLDNFHLCIWPGLPLVWIPNYSNGDLFLLDGEHWIVKSVMLNAFTDENDTLVSENVAHLFRGKLLNECVGNIFIFQDILRNKSIILIAENPDYCPAKVSIKDFKVQIENYNCGLAIGICEIGECEKLCREYLRKARKCEKLVTMSNTWGDRNGSKRVCSDFVLKEIDEAVNLGLDIVQIDDGWQMGDTAWRSARDEFNRRTFSEGYWDCNLERFPQELKPITDYANNRGVEIGMWFAPDSRNNYANLERDLNVLHKAYTEWGIRFFKLDMYWVTNQQEKELMLSFLEKLRSFGNDITVQMDVTRHSRLNYLCSREFGTVFVENRYCETTTSFPHRILRNLWDISKYIPSNRFQFEIVNPDLHSENYRDDDPFAPSKYGMDYLFAIVMLSNPLFWLEMQFLSEKRREELSVIMSVWKDHREILAKADVCPIGQKPCGRSLSGFYVSVDNKPEYLLLFREVTERNSLGIDVDFHFNSYEILSSNCNCSIDCKENRLSFSLDKQRGYAFLKLS